MDINQINLSSFDDRVSKDITAKSQSKSKSKHYQLDYHNNIPVIYIPKSVKYLKVCHQFDCDQTTLHNTSDDDVDEEEEIEEIESLYEDSATLGLENSSNHSTPLLFAMDDMDHLSKKPMNPSKSTKTGKQKKKKIDKLSNPPFYVNLKKCRKKLIEANVIINDPYLINQLCVNNIKSLKNVILNYSSAEHNRYLNFTEFCSFYSNLYEKWSKKYSQNLNIVLNNSLYDGWRYSVNKQQISLFFNKIFNKTETTILKEDQLSMSLKHRFNVRNVSELQFISKLAKCTSFFQNTNINI